MNAESRVERSIKDRLGLEPPPEELFHYTDVATTEEAGQMGNAELNYSHGIPNCYVGECWISRFSGLGILSHNCIRDSSGTGCVRSPPFDSTSFYGCRVFQSPPRCNSGCCLERGHIWPDRLSSGNDPTAPPTIPRFKVRYRLLKSVGSPS